MINRDYIEELEQSGAYIERMFHTLASYESSTYKEFLEDLSGDENLKHISDRLTEEIVDEYYNEDLEIQQLFLDYSLYGFIAEIRMPECSNFKFDSEGNFQSCSVHPGIMRCEYVFGVTMDELFDKSIKIGIDYKNEMMSKARKRE